MTILWSNDFEGTDGVYMTSANTPFNDCIPSDSAVASFSAADAVIGSTAGRYASTGLVTHKSTTWTPDGTVWLDGYIDMDTPPTSNAAIVTFWGTGDVYAAELRIQSDGYIALRDSSYTLKAEVPRVAGLQRISAKISPDGSGGTDFEIYSFSGANLHTDTPTSSATSDSADWGAVTEINRISMGILANPGNAAVLIYDDWTIGDVQRSFGVADVAAFDLLTLHDPDTADVASWEVDATGSTGAPLTLVQLSGTDVGTITDTSGVFTFNAPAGTDDLTFRLTAGTDTLDFTITRGDAPRAPIEYTFQGGDPTLAANWV